MPLGRHGGRLDRSLVDDPPARAAVGADRPFFVIAIPRRVGANQMALEQGEKPGAEVHGAPYRRAPPAGPPRVYPQDFVFILLISHKMCFAGRFDRHNVTAMRVHRIWHGTRMRRVGIGADPDCPPRLVTLPATWEDAAAAALAALVLGDGAIHVAEAARIWTAPLGSDL